MGLAESYLWSRPHSSFSLREHISSNPPSEFRVREVPGCQRGEQNQKMEWDLFLTGTANAA